MDTLAKCGKAIIILVNNLFGLIAIICLAAGIAVKFFGDKIDGLLKPVLDEVKHSIPEKAGIDVSKFSLSEFLGDAAVGFIVFGAVLLVLVFIGCCGACCKARWMLILYATVLTVLILGQIAVVIIYKTHRDVLDKAIKSPMEESLRTLYHGEQYTDAVSLGWTGAMGLMHCCGVNGYKDFEKAEVWNNTYTVEGITNAINLSAPIVCCEDKDKCTDRTTYKTYHTYNKGCYEAFWDLINRFSTIAIAVLSVLGVLQIFLLFLVIWLIRALGKDSKVHPG